MDLPMVQYTPFWKLLFRLVIDIRAEHWARIRSFVLRIPFVHLFWRTSVVRLTLWLKCIPLRLLIMRSRTPSTSTTVIYAHEDELDPENDWDLSGIAPSSKTEVQSSVPADFTVIGDKSLAYLGEQSSRVTGPLKLKERHLYTVGGKREGLESVDRSHRAIRSCSGLKKPV